MKIQLFDMEFAVCKIKELSNDILNNDFVFLSKTDEEISLVCPVESLPRNIEVVSSGWRAFRICGVLDFSLIGILANISNLLSKNNISIFAISTFNTDYILIKDKDFDKAIRILQDAGIECV